MTDIVFYQYALGGCFKQLSDAAGANVTYSQYAPGGPVEQLRVQINPAMVLNQHALGGCWAQAEVAVEGGGEEEWVVPEGAKAYIDFLAERAWTETDEEVAITTLVGNDPNVDAGVGITSEYDSGNLTADGYVCTVGTVVALLGMARTKLLAGATFRVKFKQLQLTANNNASIFVASADGSDAVEIDLNTKAPNVGDVSITSVLTTYSWGGSAERSVNNIFNYPVGSINALACTLTATRLELAASENVSTITLTLTSADRPPGNPFAGVALGFSDTFAALQSVTVYDALPTVSGLVALSQTGVTNTAPILGTTVWNVGHTGNTAGSVTTADNIAGFKIANLMANDAEGNPCTWTVSGAAGFSITGTNALTLVATKPVGTYHPIVRGTDPGGLYFDQEFIITVVI